MSGGFGRIVGGLAGAFVGSFFGQPALGFSLGSALFGSLFAEDQNEVIKGPRKGDLSVQTSTYGKALPIVYGAYRLSGNIIWLENNKIKETKNTETVEQGKGGPSKSQTRITYTYSASFAISLCEGEIDGVRKMWAGSVLILDATGDAPLNKLMKSIAVVDGEDVVDSFSPSDENEFGRVTVYKGTSTQRPHPRIQADRPDAPAYRNTAYIVFEDLELERFGNAIPPISIEVVRNGDVIPYRVFDIPNNVPDQGVSVTQDTIRYRTNINTTVDSYESPFQGTVQTSFYMTYDVVTLNKTDGTIIDQETVTATLPIPKKPNGDPYEELDNSIPTYWDKNDPDMFWCTTRNTTTTRFASRLFYNGNSWLDNLREPEEQRNIDNDTELYAGAFVKPFVILGDYMYEVGQGSFSGFVANRNYLDVRRNPKIISPQGQYGAARARYLLPNHYETEVGNSDNFGTGFQMFKAEGRLFFRAPGNTDLYEINPDPNSLEIINTWANTNTTGGSSALFGNRMIAIRADGSGGLGRVDLIRLNPDGSTTTLESTMTSYASSNILNDGVYKIDSRAAVIRDKIIVLGPFFNNTGADLGFVLDDLYQRVGVTPDVSSLNDTVKGFAVTKSMSIADAVDELAFAYRLDGVETDYALKFNKKNGNSVRTLVDSDLSVVEPGNDLVKITETIDSEQTMPRRVRVSYININKNHQRGQQYSGRIVKTTEDIVDVDLAVVMDAQEAIEAADVFLRAKWAARQTYEFSLSMDHLDIMPGDTVTLDLEELTVNVNIISIDDGSPGIRKCKAVRNGTYIYNSALIGDDGDDVEDTNIRSVGTTKVSILDIPALRKQEGQQQGVYMAVKGVLPDWPGANIYQGFSTDLELLFSIFNDCTIGSATDKLPDAVLTTTWDDTGSLTVNVSDGTFESKPESDVLNFENLIAVESGDGWEIIQFVNAVDNGDGTYTLSRFLRGRYGTEWATSGHAVGNRVVQLNKNSEGIRFVPQDLSKLGNAINAYGQTLSTSLNEATLTVDSNFEAINLKPWSPVHIDGVRDGSDNLDISWVRRARYDNGWIDLIDVPLVEDTESYEIDILDGNGDVVRTLTSSTTSVTYTAADQTTDFGSAQASVDVLIYQLSATIGRGYAGSATL